MHDREEHLVPIGRFSQLTRLSLKALRLYDENGLLRPALVDADTGYRYYRAEQRRRASFIRLLRSLEMPLDQIREVLDAAAGDASARLTDWWTAREASIDAGRRTVLLIQRLLQGQEDTMGFEVKVKDVPAQPALSRQGRMTVERLEPFITSSCDALYQESIRLGARPAGPPMTIFHGEVNTEADGPVEVCLPLDRQVTSEDGAFVATELAGGQVAYTMVDAAHADFPEILEAYDAISAFIEARGHEVAASPREIYLVPKDGYAGAVERGHPVFEIDWPIR